MCLVVMVLNMFSCHSVGGVWLSWCWICLVVMVLEAIGCHGVGCV